MNEIGSLKASLDANDTIGAIRQSINSPIEENLIWLLVEGETDCRLYHKFIDISKANVVRVHGGFFQLQKAINELIHVTNKLIGIRDADFLNLIGENEEIPNLLCTDYHDIEMMMIADDNVFINTCMEYLHSTTNFILFRDTILNHAKHIGYIKLYNFKNNTEIKFAGLGLGDIYIEVEPNIWSLQRTKLIEKLNIRSVNKKNELTEAIIDNFINLNLTTDYLNLCCGHDVVELISLHLKSISSKTFASNLRISYRFEDFRKTELFQKLKHWEISEGFDFIRNN